MFDDDLELVLEILTLLKMCVFIQRLSVTEEK